MKNRCSCTEKEKGEMHCNMITEEDRKQLFESFWALSWGQKKVYIVNLIKALPTNRKRDRKNPEESKRSRSFIYFLKKGEDMVRVCRTLFLNTFSLGKNQVWGWKTAGSQSKKEQTVNKTVKKKPFDEECKTLNDFLDALPKMESHYCRKRTKKLYLLPEIKSKRQLYEIYVDYCRSHQVNSLSIATLSNALTIKNIALFKPKKDQCEICNSFKLGHITKDFYEEHVKRKNEARIEKESDKIKEEFVFTADLQAVLLAPRSNVSTNYYKTKLCVHNWCIFDMKSTDGYCFVWNEAEGGLNSDEFATILTNYFVQNVIPKMGEDNRRIVIFTDGCTYQNRNITLANALLNVAMLHNVVIEHKYLEVGHTQMEVDSMHAMIEKKLKDCVINVPAEYITFCKKARKAKPYNVEYLTYSYFKNFKDVAFYKSIRPGKMKGDPKVTDIRGLKYMPSGEISYKLNFSDAYKPLNQRKFANTPVKNLTNLYKERRKITKKKYLDLQQLKTAMPKDYQTFYDNLPHED